MLVREPREADAAIIEQMRETLRSQLDAVDLLRQEVTTDTATYQALPNLPGAEFDDVDAAEGQNAAAAMESAEDTTDGASIAPEARPIYLPSTCAGMHSGLRAMEVTMRTEQANRALHLLRDNIANKSFHYSHVLRIAPNQGVRTRARTEIVALSKAIAFQGRIYSRSRAALIRLEAPAAVLKMYQPLQKDHIKCTTAIRNPNLPGSTTQRLSWIWRIGEAADIPDNSPAGLAALLECRYLVI